MWRRETGNVNNRTVSIRVSDEDHEWLRRYAHWEGVSIAELLRARVHSLVAEVGYLRPPDDEPQDFGDEKALMQWVVSIQEETGRNA